MDELMNEGVSVPLDWNGVVCFIYCDYFKIIFSKVP